MVDILILRRKDRAILIPETEKGRKWIIENMTGPATSSAAVTIHIDVASDMEIEIKANGLDVEVK